ncbi:hypothetical protein, partial [Acinetobacter baumannii]|uniref:hypothetical protein n=1 Tax=Acinetobacter baumannii TaxID=470 RepID=UPI001C074B14
IDSFECKFSQIRVRTFGSIPASVPARILTRRPWHSFWRQRNSYPSWTLPDDTIVISALHPSLQDIVEFDAAGQLVAYNGSPAIGLENALVLRKTLRLSLENALVLRKVWPTEVPRINYKLRIA